jgi:hypothetical protein
MWLLDANMDVHLIEILNGLGVNSDTDLVAKAAAAGFTCLLTRDRRFGESAARALRAFPSFAVVVVVLPQVDSEMHLKQLRAAWSSQPIEPAAGRLIHWPHSTNAS